MLCGRRIRVVLHAAAPDDCIHYVRRAAAGQRTGDDGGDHDPMEGVRILEVAQFTFTPAAGAVLADWGADVIKVEHAVTGDAQRGMGGLVGLARRARSTRSWSTPTAGKRSIGLALEDPEALEVLYELVAHAATCSSPTSCPTPASRLRIDVDDIRAVNPDIVYVRGSAFGVRGDESTPGWLRRHRVSGRAAARAAGVQPPDYDGVLGMPGPAYGDSIGGMTIAGGIAAALLARERTGETSVVDVSLLGVGRVGERAVGRHLARQRRAVAGRLDGQPARRPHQPGRRAGADVRRSLRLPRDDPGLEVLGRLLPSPRAARHDRRPALGHPREAASPTRPRRRTIVHEVHRIEALRLLGRDASATLEGQWAPVQDSLELGHDPQVRANGLHRRDHRRRRRDARAGRPTRCSSTRRPPRSAGPRSSPSTPTSCCASSGIDDERLLALKISGAVT